MVIQLETRDSVLGGLMVFRNTRLSVLHVGKMARRGVPAADILADYPYLTAADVEFAARYYEPERT